MRLGLNIDHIATLREARKTTEPDLLQAALIAEKLGVDQITVHLRSDRRHIQDIDLQVLKANIKIPFNIEMSLTTEMREIAAKIKPDKLTLVPERINEITTEGGLDVISNRQTIERFKDYLSAASENTLIAIFVDPSKEQIDACKELGIEEIEINTGQYAEANNTKDIKFEIERIKYASKTASKLGIEVAAGHGLNESNLPAILQIEEIKELNIGHHIIADSIFLGLNVKIERILKLLKPSK